MKRSEFIRKYNKKIHIGDGVYSRFDGYNFILTTPRDNGEHFIFLEPAVLNNLNELREKIYEQANEIED